MSKIPDYDFAKLAKGARREQQMRRVVFGKKVEKMTMEPEAAQALVDEMDQIAQVLERLAEWKAKKAEQHEQPTDAH